MSDITLTTAVILCAVAFLAGWVDAVVGGGGLIQLPALLIGLPAHLPPTYALGTNKVVSVCGTTVAALTYARKAPLDLRLALRLASLALVSAAGGALFASAVDKQVLQPLIMVVLLAVAGFVVLRPQFGTAPAGTPSRRRSVLATLVTGIGIGFYDGLIGPGTGTFLVIALVGLARMSMLTASATAKVVNVGTNVGGLLVFAANGSVLWGLFPFMAALNMAGGWTGARTAVRRGSGFVRIVLLVVVTALVARLAYDQWWA
ncbi:TSUP family transporter [Streptomyces sp. RFCAC02]|uniref:sulfite exporter TauE/SafE family protein n=1 Tax=Streptomyces sp. RFCAC02 TaxID=2499143 RepID=UPI00101EC211|nr:TSUP family transporter [Streptomyces sp. RFCAC02]